GATLRWRERLAVIDLRPERADRRGRRSPLGEVRRLAILLEGRINRERASLHAVVLLRLHELVGAAGLRHGDAGREAERVGGAERIDVEAGVIRVFPAALPAVAERQGEHAVG